MRRKEREVTDEAKIEAAILSCQCCRLGFYDGEEVYIVPLNFGYERREDGKRIFYFHGAKAGRKAGLIAQSPRVGFELDGNYQLKEGQTACEYSAAFISVMGTGRVSFIEGESEKTVALQSLMLHETGKRDWSFPPAMLNAVAVFQLEVEKISCKEHL